MWGRHGRDEPRRLVRGAEGISDDEQAERLAVLAGNTDAGRQSYAWRWTVCMWCTTPNRVIARWPCRDLLLDAAVYADRLGWRDEWRARP
jgi:hypothetical protein